MDQEKIEHFPKGRIVQVSGPVVDAAFPTDRLPAIGTALKVDNHGKTGMMEVVSHIGEGDVRCIMLSASEGLHKDITVQSTGGPLKVPVGEKTLGRLFNVLGETIDGGEPLDTEEHWSIHRKSPGYAEQVGNVEILETGIKVIDLLAPYAKGGKVGLFGGRFDLSSLGLRCVRIGLGRDLVLDRFRRGVQLPLDDAVALVDHDLMLRRRLTGRKRKEHRKQQKHGNDSFHGLVPFCSFHVNMTHKHGKTLHLSVSFSQRADTIRPYGPLMQPQGRSSIVRCASWLPCGWYAREARDLRQQ